MDFEMHHQTPQKEIEKKGTVANEAIMLPPLLNEIADTNPNQQSHLLAQHLAGKKALTRIIEMLPNELTKRPDVLPISFVNVEMEIARCISECLLGFPAQKRNISTVLSYVQDYKVVRPVSGQNPSVSLLQIHVILQDNYKGSSLCMLLDIMLGEFKKTTTKTITF